MKSGSFRSICNRHGWFALINCASLAIVEANATPAPTIVDDDSFEKELCKAKEAGEWFRLQAGEGDNCRDVIQCTSSVRWPIHLNYYLFFSLLSSLATSIMLNVFGYLGFASYPLPCWSGIRYREADLRLEGAGEELPHQRESAQIEANPVNRRTPLPGRHVGLSRRHLHRAQPLLQRSSRLYRRIR